LTVTAEENILLARQIIVDELLHEIKEILIDDERPRLEITFLKGFKAYIRYNDFGEYSYQLTFSQKVNDRIRYDNFDKKWPVTTQPNHLHPKGDLKAINSPMKRNPLQDIPLLIQNDIKPIIE